MCLCFFEPTGLVKSEGCFLGLVQLTSMVLA